jgi:two-component system, LytTR family, response regulator
MLITCIVIEDEPLALKKLAGFIKKIDYLSISGTFDNAIDAISYLKSNTVDIVFLDIQMEDFSGIQFLESLRQRPKVIVTTAYDKYAIQGYELDVADYLLKPITFERFVQAVEKVTDSISTKIIKPASDFIFVKTEYRHEKIKVSDILYIQGMSEYLRIVTEDKKIMTLQNFKTLQDVLPEDLFVRVHKSYIVAIDIIESIERNRIKIKELNIPVSETYIEGFYNKLGIGNKSKLPKKQ